MLGIEIATVRQCAKDNSKLLNRHSSCAKRAGIDLHQRYRDDLEHIKKATDGDVQNALNLFLP